MIPTRFNLTVPDFYRLKQQPPILRSIPLGSTLFLMAEPNTRGLQQSNINDQLILKTVQETIAFAE